MARFLTIVLLLHVSLMVVALVDCLSASERGIRALPRAGWIFLILLASPVGAVAWLLIGKPLPAPEVRRGPEDDPAFIASLAATIRPIERD
jgi:phospholipase D-like protein